MTESQSTAPQSTEPQGTGSDASALLSRVHLIEDQPLDQRAAAFAQVHDALQHTLDSSEPARHHG